MLINQRFGRLLTLDRVILAGGTIQALAKLVEQPQSNRNCARSNPARGAHKLSSGMSMAGASPIILNLRGQSGAD